MLKHINKGLLVLALSTILQSCGNKAAQSETKTSEISVQELVLSDAQMQNANINFSI